MDRQRKKKLRNIRVLMTNIFMALSVIAIVAIFMLIAMGYSINEDGSLEQAGLIKFESNPDGATITIDDETQLAHTNTSKMLSSGTHSIKITKSGYDTWHKELTVDVGLLTTIDWVRLFPLSPTITDIVTFDDFRLVSVSPDHKKLAVVEVDSDILNIINTQGEKLKYDNITLSTALAKNKDVANSGTLNVVSWNNNDDKILLTQTINNQTTWHLIDLTDASKSINLSSKFEYDFTSMLIANDSASKLWSIEDGDLRLIDITALTISNPIDEKVIASANNGDTVAYITDSSYSSQATSAEEQLNDEAQLDANKQLDNEEQSSDQVQASDNASEQTSASAITPTYALNIFKEGEDGSTQIAELEDYASDTLLAMGTYWDNNWLAYNVGSKIAIYGGSYPSYGKASTSFKNIFNTEATSTPTSISYNTDERIVAFANEQNIYTYDIETKNHTAIATDNTSSSTINWLDSYITWETTNDGKVIIRDFDGDNRREIISDHNNSLPIYISQNNKWLYFFEYDNLEIVNDDTSSDNAQQGSTATATKYILKREKLEL